MKIEEFLDSAALQLERATRAFELACTAFAADNGKRKKAQTTKGIKPDAPRVRGEVTHFYEKNDYGFTNFIIDKDKGNKKFSTKSSDIAEIAKDAFTSGAIVEVVYNEKKKGDYMNRYALSIEILDPDQAAQRPAPQLPPEDNSEPAGGDEAPW